MWPNSSPWTEIWSAFTSALFLSLQPNLHQPEIYSRCHTACSRIARKALEFLSREDLQPIWYTPFTTFNEPTIRITNSISSSHNSYYCPEWLPVARFDRPGVRWITRPWRFLNACVFHSYFLTAQEIRSNSSSFLVRSSLTRQTASVCYNMRYNSGATLGDQWRFR